MILFEDFLRFCSKISSRGDSSSQVVVCAELGLIVACRGGVKGSNMGEKDVEQIDEEIVNIVDIINKCNEVYSVAVEIVIADVEDNEADEREVSTEVAAVEHEILRLN